MGKDENIFGDYVFVEGVNYIFIPATENDKWDVKPEETNKGRILVNPYPHIPNIENELTFFGKSRSYILNVVARTVNVLNKLRLKFRNF